MGVHENLRPYKCTYTYCDAAFKENAKLKEHINWVHLLIRQFDCKICGKGFKQNAHMRKHVEFIHEGRRPYGCPLCDGRFCTNSELKRHILSVHEGIRRDRKKENDK